MLFAFSKLEQAGLPHEVELADLNSLTAEFTDRLSVAESRLKIVTRERDELQAQLKAPRTTAVTIDAAPTPLEKNSR